MAAPSLRLRGGELPLDRVRIMGVVNLTPDSFYDGGRHAGIDGAVSHALRLAEQGADILDLGGVSSRPGAADVSEDEELSRVVPAVEALARRTKAWVSVDSFRPRVAREALAAGAHLLNDVKALAEPGMAEDCARQGAGVVLMHMKGSPRTMQEDPRYADVVEEVRGFLVERAEFAVAKGVAREAIAIDPGIGFGKTVEHNLSLLRRLDRLRDTGYPVLVGASRKSFIGKLLDREVGDRLAGSLGVAAWCLLQGAAVLRVHDVSETRDVARMIEALRKEDL